MTKNKVVIVWQYVYIKTSSERIYIQENQSYKYEGSVIFSRIRELLKSIPIEVRIEVVNLKENSTLDFHT